jgi:probable F420-dependent oxidoreductase
MSNQSPEPNRADTSEGLTTGESRLAEATARLHELLERGEISPEAFAEYSAMADAELSSTPDGSGHTHDTAPSRFVAERSRSVQVGVIYPQTELPTDPNTVRTYVRTVEELGYRHFAIYDHVLGADPAVHTGWEGPYDVDTTFHEPLVLYGFLAAVTQLELVTGIIVAPQRQTALLAKQAAEVDILSEGRLRLGIGAGWNPVEYEALSQDFSTRGRRQEEQIGLLRRLWTERSVTHEGTFDRIVGAGLAPLPTQRPIPIWLGGQSPASYRRMGRLADGWFPRIDPGPDLDEARAIISAAAAKAGRDPATIGMDARIRQGAGGTEDLVRDAQRWRAAGATHVSVDTMGSGLPGLKAHLDALARAGEALQLAHSAEARL